MYLEWYDNDGELARLALDPAMEPVTIGRGQGSTIYLKETSVSRNHARIGWEPAGFYLKDLGSSNGSFINNERVTRGTLKDGDVARCGEVLEIRVCAGALPDAKRKTLQMNESAQRRAPAQTAALNSAEREALVAAARAARLGQAGAAGLRTDARPVQDAAPRPDPRVSTPPREAPAVPEPRRVPEPPRQPEPPRPQESAPAARSGSQPALQIAPDAQRRIAELEDQLHAARTALAKVEADAKATESRSMRYSVELDGLSDKYVKLKEHNQILSQELDKTRAALRNRDDEVFEAQRALEDLTTQMAQARDKAADATEQLSGLKVRITQKDRQIEELQRQLDLLEYDLRAARDENDSLQSSFNREGGDLSRLERKINLLQEVIQEKEALVAQLRVDLRDKDTEIRQVRMGVGISDLEHEKRRLLEDFHLATRRVDELNDRLVQQTRQNEALQAELAAAREAAERKPVVTDVTEHPDFKQKQRELDRTRDEVEQLQRDLATAHQRLGAAHAEMHQQKMSAAELQAAQKRAENLTAELQTVRAQAAEPVVPDGVAEEVETLLDTAVAARSNAAVVRRYAEDLRAQRDRLPELADTLELVHDMASLLADDLATQARDLETLHRKLAHEPPER